MAEYFINLKYKQMKYDNYGRKKSFLVSQSGVARVRKLIKLLPSNAKVTRLSFSKLAIQF